MLYDLFYGCGCLWLECNYQQKRKIIDAERAFF